MMSFDGVVCGESMEVSLSFGLVLFERVEEDVLVQMMENDA